MISVTQISLVIVAGLLIGTATLARDENNANDYYTYKVVPDIINTNPVGYLDVDYGYGVGPKTGNTLSFSMASRQPISIKAGDEYVDPESYYTLIMVDPDAPEAQNPSQRSYLHWMKTNMEGKYLTPTSMSYSGGQDVMEFEAPNPSDNDYHRYVFLLYRQNEKLNIEPNSIERANFDVRQDFQDKYQLFNIDYGNFFRAKPDA